MKYFILLFIFISGISNAQIVNIPDAEFKGALILLGVDTNSDGEIQESEALVPTSLILSNATSNITDLTGIEAFVNLEELICYFNQLTSLDLSQNVNLQQLRCENNNITSLNVSQNIALTQLFCGSNSLSSLDLSQNINLEYFGCSSNNLNTLDVSQNTNLITLQCNSNPLNTLDVSQNINLLYLYCRETQLSAIDVTQNVNLENFQCDFNSITELDITQNPNINYLDCASNLLTDLDVTQNTNLEYLFCYQNQLSNINLSQNINLIGIRCQLNDLLTLDLSQNRSINQVICNDNELESLYIKNGAIESVIDFENNPNLIFICTDETQIETVQAQAEPMTVVSTYCTFEPGGDFNTISGSMIFDDNEDGCDPTDLPQPHIKIDINDGVNPGSTFTNTNGNYTFYTLDGSFDITPNLEQPSWFTVSPIAATIPFTDTNNNVATQDFCMSANGVHNDVEIAIAPITPARPGFDAVYQIVYNNKGNQTLSGSFDLTYDETVLDFISATEIPDVQSPGNLVWNYSDLLPFENRTVYLTLNVNSPTETPPVNIDDELGFVTSINPISGDEFTSDNTFEYKQVVVGSFDPNDITCLQGNILPTTEIGNFLHYIINFENEGNAPAENVVVEVEVDETKFDINTLRILNASHNVQTQVENNKIKFIFIDVNLEASGGHGNILIRMKSDEALLSGDTVMKQADIHFDYNFPIETNTANTTYQNLSVDEFQIDNTIQLYPNPTQNKINVKASSQIKSIQIFDIHGRLILTKLIDLNEVLLDISEYSSGVYMFKVNSTNGSRVERIIKY